MGTPEPTDFVGAAGPVPEGEPPSRRADAPTSREPLQSLDSLARSWRATSEQLFAGAATDPQGYVRATRLVGAVAARLRTMGRGAGPLLAAWDEHEQVVLRVAAGDDLLTTEGLDLAAVAAAAFAMRHREVANEVATDARAEAIAALPPDEWSTIEESGYSPGDPFVPYRRLEVHPATGRALLVLTAPDEGYRSCTHLVQALLIDTSTGELTEPDDGTEDTGVRQFDSETDREAHVRAARTPAPPQPSGTQSTAPTGRAGD